MSWDEWTQKSPYCLFLCPKSHWPGAEKPILETAGGGSCPSTSTLGEISPGVNDSVRWILTKLKFNFFFFVWRRNSYPLQYSGLDNSMDHLVHGVTKSWTRLSDLHFPFLKSSNWYHHTQVVQLQKNTTK